MAIRRFIVCFDSTWNTPDKGANPTNVVKIVRAVANLADGISQVTFYDKGVGTGDLPDRIVGGASGKGLTENMVDGYRFLANNYADDDEIYIFGFSRGAYTARSLAGFIGLAGLFSLLELGSSLTKAIDVYRNTELTREQRPEKIREFGLDRKEDVPIRCVGVWDTVGSLGIPGDLGRRLLEASFDFHDVQLNPKVEVALHAAAVDEKRSAFAPTLWVRPKDAPAPAGQVIEQVWFPGVHSNVGGSHADAGLSDVALDWMIKRVQQLTSPALGQASGARLSGEQERRTRGLPASQLGRGCSRAAGGPLDCSSGLGWRDPGRWRGSLASGIRSLRGTDNVVRGFAHGDRPRRS